MGRTYLFDCPKCGYRARVAGGPDRGFRFAVQTILCTECKQLHDAVTEFKMATVPPLSEPLARKQLKSMTETRRRKTQARPPTFAAALSRLPLAHPHLFKWVEYKPACPVSPLHRFRVWKHPDRCPKCGVLMEQNALPFRIWD